MFDFSEWKDKPVVMHCKTEKEAKAFCKEMHDAGLLWGNGEEYIKENCWEYFKEETCYDFNDARVSQVEFYRYNEYKILEYSDYFKNEKEDKSYKLSKKEINLCELLGKGYISRFLDNSLVWSKESPKMGSDLYIVKGGTLDINEFRNELNINVEDLNFDFIKKGEIYKVEELLRMVGK